MAQGTMKYYATINRIRMLSYFCIGIITKIYERKIRKCCYYTILCVQKMEKKNVYAEDLFRRRQKKQVTLICS